MYRLAGRGMVPTAVLAALATVAACGFWADSDSRAGEPAGGSGHPDARSVAALRAAEKATGRAGSARITSTSVMGDLLAMRTDGALGWAGAATGRLRLTYTGGQLAETMRKLNSSPMEARLLPDAYYAKVGDEFAARIHGKHWIRYDYDDLASLPGGSGTYLKEQLANTAPIPPVKLLLVSRDVHRVGEEEVRGERTTHYSGTVDVADLKDTDALKAQLEQAGVTTETVDVWVNGDDLLVKKVEKGELATGSMSSTAYYSDYGVRVPAQEPPAGDTADFQELMKSQGATS
ncbi:hypothetical protein ACIP79_40365 [Streptomyces sp. NPDC088747]|uniref:hypothetical protein n=1 Tax=Streptomyces sp. NPDC088747 TaxID=3365886 RepID=UPI0038063F68